MFSIISTLNLGRAGIRMLGNVGGLFVSKGPTAGFAQLQKVLGDLPDEMMKETQKANEQSIANIKKDLMVYPTANAGSTYTRTFELRTGWIAAPIQTTNIMTGYLGEKITRVDNPVPYTKWVQQKSTQTRWNRFRWTTVEDTIERHTPNIVDRIAMLLDILSRSI